MRPILAALTPPNPVSREFARLVGFCYHGRSLLERYCVPCGERGVTQGLISPDMLESIFSNQRIGNVSKCVDCGLTIRTLDAKEVNHG